MASGFALRMCLALYIAADKPLPIIPWQAEAPAFHVTELPREREAVRAQFALPHVYYAGSDERCGCPFNYGREYPEHEVDPVQLAAARECVARLSAYVRESGVRQIYSCQFDDEHTPRDQQRLVTPEQLRAEAFVFHERELLEVDHAASQQLKPASVAKRPKVGKAWQFLHKRGRG